MDFIGDLPLLIRVVLLVSAVLVAWLFAVLVPRFFRSAFKRIEDSVEDQPRKGASNDTSSPTT